jgi:hypothetical protein
MVNFLTRILELKRKIFLKRRMYISAIELTGLIPDNLIQKHTKKIFSEIINNNPGITLDNAILIFEKASPNITLEQFAISKHRTVASYRKVYKLYF